MGSEFVTISFFYLHSDDYADTISNNNPPGHVSLVSGYEGFKAYQKWEEENPWCRTPKELRAEMVGSDAYKACRKRFEDEQRLYDRKLRVKRVAKYCLLAGGWDCTECNLGNPGLFTGFGRFFGICKRSNREWFDSAAAVRDCPECRT